VATADGTSRVLTVTMHGTNDAAVITGSSTAALTETNAAQSTGGDLDATDVDSSAAFVAQTDVAGNNGFGKFSIDATGAWTYTMNSAHDEFVGGQEYTDSITVATADGTSRVLTVTMHGTNDAAMITGSSTAELSETDAAQSTGGDLNATDVDSLATFVAQTDAAGSNGYGKFSIDGTGAWTYTMNNAHDEFVGGQEYTDSITVATADGTSRVLTVTMHGSNDAAVITGSGTAVLTESNAAQSTGGDLNATDVDSSNAFVVQTNAAGSNGYGTFSIDASGAWTYTMDTAHDEFAGGQDYTDSITVATADGTSKVLTVTMHGTNDAAVITGSSTAALTESNVAQSTGGNLDATDIDSSNAFAVQTNAVSSNGYGKFSIDASGTWTYTMNNAHDEFVAGQQYTDSITVQTIDGTPQLITVTLTGTSDGPLPAPVPYTGTGDPNDNDGATNTTSSSSNGDNVIVGTDADNILTGIDDKDGADKIYGGGGNDTITGGDKGDELYGNTGSDSLSGGDQNDLIYGGSGNDTIQGGSQTDTIYGGSGSDTILGNDHNDFIIGGFGADTLTGNDGADIFRYLDARDTGDTITDFSKAQGDKIDFAALDAGTLGFTAGTALSSHSVNFYYDANSNKTVVQVDTDGDVSDVELQIELTGNIPLAATDFSL
jgi:VCBS repeat-containing protein